MATRERVSDYYASLPGKRIGAGLLCRDADDRVLLVQPTYKPTWELPGGVVEAGESPAACAAREVREELGLDLPIGRLLVVDWLPVRPPKTEGLMMQFDGGVLDDGVTRRFRLPPHELAAWRWFSDADLDEVLPDYMARRTRAALDAARSGSSAYLEWGRRLPASAELPDPHRPIFVLMKGAPGSGKSTIARELGRRLRWPVIDKDVFRDLLPDELGGLSYEAMLDLAERQLTIGLSVIADSPLGYGTGYRKALEIAERAGASVVIVECECSDPDEGQGRGVPRAGLARSLPTRRARRSDRYDRAPRTLTPDGPALDWQTLAMTSGGSDGVEYSWRGEFDNDELNAVHAEAFGHAIGDEGWRRQVERYSLGWVCARQDGELVGWVNVAWDGGVHAFVLDTIVARARRHRGIGTRLVAMAVEQARLAGCERLHVDFDDELATFYFDACGFAPTPAGVIALR